MITDEFESGTEDVAKTDFAERPKSLLPLALAVGAAAAIIMTILTLI